MIDVCDVCKHKDDCSKLQCGFNHKDSEYVAMEKVVNRQKEADKNLRELVLAAMEVKRISERKHDAWDRLENALRPYKELSE